MSAVETTLRDCPLRPGPYPALEATCAWCGSALPKRRKRWCSDECSRAIGRNHDWNSARMAAMRRDGSRCVKCGAPEGWPEGHAWWGLLVVFAPWPERGSDVSLHRAGLAVLERGERQRRLEVNHKVPIIGKHGQWGCHHHLDGIETLCRPCHVAETARQFRDGEIRRGRVA